MEQTLTFQAYSKVTKNLYNHWNEWDVKEQIARDLRNKAGVVFSDSDQGEEITGRVMEADVMDYFDRGRYEGDTYTITVQKVRAGKSSSGHGMESA